MNVEFKFHYVVDGAQKGFLARKAHVSEDELVLDGQRLPFAWVTDTHARESRIVLALQPTEEPGEELASMMRDGILVLDVAGIPAVDLERRIDRVASRLMAEAHRKALEAEGRGDEIRIETCPFCDSTVDLCELPKTKNVYCRHCDSLFVPGRIPDADEKDTRYCVCPECQFYGRVQEYTLFHFYFLLVVYGWRMQTKALCEGCARKSLWKALFINLIFILGVPTAIWGLIKSYTGSRPDMARLAEANAAAAAGNYREADPIYARIMEGHPDHPGLLMNQGLGHLLGKDGDTAVAHFQKSLKSSPNYLPAIRLIQRISAAAESS